MAREKKNTATPAETPVATPAAPLTAVPAPAEPEVEIEEIPDASARRSDAAAGPITFVLDAPGDEFGDGGFDDGLVDEDDGEMGEDGDDDGEDGDDVPFEQIDELADAVMHVAEQLSTSDGESFADVLAGIRQNLAAQNEVLDKQYKVLYKLYATLAGK